MNRIFKPAFVLMASLALMAPSFGAMAAASTGAEPDITDISKKTYPSVVRVVVQNGTRRVATGVVIEKGGYIVTTALVSPRDEKITVTTSEGKDFAAEFLGFDTETQVALLRAKDVGAPPVTLGKASDLAAGSWICVVGVSPERTAAVTQGIVSSVADSRLRLNVWVTPSASGSPVIDGAGRMVGLLRGIYMEEKPVVFSFRDKEQSGSGYVFSSRAEAPSSGMAVAVPVDVVKDVSAEIKDKGKVERGWLGVTIGTNDDGRTEIASIEPDSPAELAKLKVGDIVLKIGDRDVTSSDVLASEIRGRKPGQDVALKIERDGKPMDVKAKLGAYPENEAMREMEVRFPDFFRRIIPEPGPRGLAPERAPKPGAPRPAQPRVETWSFETTKFIGAYCQALNPELADYFGIKGGKGLLVSRLTPDGPAEKAKLRVGDVIVRVDGKAVETVDELIDLVQQKAKGEKVKLEIVRDKKTMTLEVEVEEEKESGFFEGGGFRDFLESWQDYTNAFEREIRKWDSERIPELRKDMARIKEELAQRSKDSAQKAKTLLRGILRRV